MKFLFLIIKILIFAEGGYIQNKFKEPKFLKVVRINGECRGHDVVMQSWHHGLKCSIRSAFVANHTGIVKNDIVDDLKLNFTIIRCKSRENLDSCEEFQKYKFLNFCAAIDPDNVLSSHSPFSIPYEPKFKCPIKKGIYRAYNTTLDISALNFLQVDNWYWKAKIDVFAPKKQNKMMYCIEMEGQTVSKSQI